MHLPAFLCDEEFPFYIVEFGEELETKQGPPHTLNSSEGRGRDKAGQARARVQSKRCPF
jgi:hypothetical protein